MKLSGWNFEDNGIPDDLDSEIRLLILDFVKRIGHHET
jgi:hypothetical protein